MDSSLPSCFPASYNCKFIKVLAIDKRFHFSVLVENGAQSSQWPQNRHWVICSSMDEDFFLWPFSVSHHLSKISCKVFSLGCVIGSTESA